MVITMSGFQLFKVEAVKCLIQEAVVLEESVPFLNMVQELKPTEEQEDQSAKLMYFHKYQSMVKDQVFLVV